MKDIFIDNNIASKFTNPLDPEILKLINWLVDNKETKKENSPHLVVCNKLLSEYNRSCNHCDKGTNIHVIIHKLTIENRLNSVTNNDIKEFKRQHYTKKTVRNLTCNKEDRELLPAIMLSNRKIAVVRDNNFCNDINSFPGFNAIASKSPKYLKYK